jgi:hypothetical protein
MSIGLVVDHAFLLRDASGGGGAVALREFPPRQKPASFNLDAVLAQVPRLATARRSSLI